MRAGGGELERGSGDECCWRADVESGEIGGEGSWIGGVEHQFHNERARRSERRSRGQDVLSEGNKPV